MFNKIFAVLAAKGDKPDQLMIDATLFKTHCTAASLLERDCSLTYRAHQRGLNSKLHAICDGNGRPLIIALSKGQLSDYKSAGLMLDALPKAKTLLGERSYDAEWFRAAMASG